jgi:hypothetical protein
MSAFRCKFPKNCSCCPPNREAFEELRLTNNSLAIGYEARGKEIKRHADLLAALKRASLELARYVDLQTVLGYIE